jgi:hypothetical protein
MDEQRVHDYLCSFAGVKTSQDYGFTFYFYGTDRMLPFATLGSKDNEGDRISNLDREGVYRLSVGLSKADFQAEFGSEQFDIKNYDFTALDTIMPHPDYAVQSWICVLNPSDSTFARLEPWLHAAYERAVQRAARREQAK